MWWLWLGAVLLVSPAPDLVLRSGSDCPSGADVRSQVLPLLPAGTTVEIEGDAAAASAANEPRSGERVELSFGDGARWVRLYGSDGRLSRERALPGTLTCAEAARAAAVFVAAWEFQGLVEPPAATRATIPAPPVARANPTGAIDRFPAPRRLGLGAGVAASWADGQATGVLLEGLVGRSEGVGLRLRAGASAQSRLALGPGGVNLTTASLGMGPTFTIRRRQWLALVHGEIVGVRRSISGEGFTVNETGTQWAVGGAAGGRLGRQIAATDLWLDLTVTGWSGRGEIALRDVPNRRDLARWELGLGLGLDFFLDFFSGR